MNSAQGSLRSQRTRKSMHTYSLTVNGDSYVLTSLPSSAPSATTAKPPPSESPPPSPPPKGRNIYSQAFSPVVSSSRLYSACVSVPRGPRNTNLYLYPPTEADYANARRRSISRAAATEDAQREREDDERRRNIILGIAPPRKSTRKTRSKTNVESHQDPPLVAVEKLTSVIERGCRKGRRTASKVTKSVIQPEPVIGDASVSIVSPSLSLVSLPPSSEETPSARKLRRKSQPRSNPRPTPRLTTRSLAKAKAASLGGDDCGITTTSIAPSESEYGEPIYVNVEDHNGSISVPCHQSLSKSPAPPGGGKHIDTVARLGFPGLRSGVDGNRTSLSSYSSFPSSDTLCDDVESMPRDFPKDGTSLVTGTTDIRPEIFRSSSRSSATSTSSLSLMNRIPPPPSTAFVPLTTATATNHIGRNKRKFEETETEPNIPPQPQCRRSSRVPKKRKL